jgi:hypothetical protein
MMGPTGAVESCEVITSAGSPALDRAACASGAKAAGATPATTPSGTPVLSVQALSVRFAAYVRWAPSPEGHDISNVYPARAQRLGVSGHAVIRCEGVGGGITGCVIVEESPPGFDFGLAALRLARTGLMRIAPDQQGEVLVPMQFDLGRGPPPPSGWVAVHGSRAP